MPPKPTTRFRLLPTLAVIVAAWFVLCWPWLSGAVTVPWDSKAHFQPQLAFLARSLGMGQLPFWTPNVFAGHPQIADPQSLIFSPPFLLMALIMPAPGLVALDAAVFASLLVGAVFIVLYFRDRSWAEAGAIVAALSFAFGGAAAWRIQHVGQVVSLAYLPIALWLLDRAIVRTSARYGFFAGLVAGLMLLGRDQVAYLGILSLAVYALLKLVERRRAGWRIMKPLGAGALGGILVVTVPMLMTLLLAEDSNRPMITLSEAGKGSLHPWSLLTGIIPHLFGISRPLADYWGPPSPDWGPVDLYLARNMATFYFGILPVLGLALFPFLWRFRARFAGFGQPDAVDANPHRRDALFLFAMFAVLMLYSLGRYTPFFSVIFATVPGIDRFRRPADALFVACAFGSMAGGYGVHRWISEPTFRLPKWVIVLGMGLLAALFVSAGLLSASVSKLDASVAPIAAALCFTGAALLAMIILRRLPQRSVAALLAIGIFMSADLGWNNAPNESTGLAPETYEALIPGTSNPLIVQLKAKLAATRGPDRIDRIELAGIDFHIPNAPMVHDMHHTLGYNPVRSRIYSESVGARDHIAGPDQRLFTPLMPSYRSRMADLLGLRYIATGVPMQDLYNAVPDNGLPRGKWDPAELPLIAQVPGAYIYENPRALPRVLFAGNALQADFDALTKSGTWPDVDPQQTVLLDRAVLPNESTVREGPRSARIVSYRNTEVVIEATSETGGFVVLNDAWHDWWQVEIDRKPAQIEQANVTFRAVWTPPGTHEVRFVFRPFRGALAEMLRRR